MLDIFEDYLYVSLYRSHSIVKLHKFRNSTTLDSDMQYLMRNMTSVFDIIVMHPSKQKRNSENFSLLVTSILSTLGIQNGLVISVVWNMPFRSVGVKWLMDYRNIYCCIQT